MPPQPDTCQHHSGHATQLAEHERRIRSVEYAVLDIRDRLLGRPSWVVVALITLLTSSTVGLLVAVINIQSQGVRP